jgi:hypothetical protein
VRTEGDQRIVVFATVADRKMVRWVKVGGEKLRGLEWADDDNVMITTSITDSLYGFSGERFMLRVYSLSRNEVRSLPGNVLQIDDTNHILNAVFGDVMVGHIDGHTVVFVSGVDLTLGAQLYRCDLTTRSTKVFRAYDESSASWLVDAHGELAAEQDYDAQTQRWSIRIFHGGSSREAVSGHAALDVPQVLGFGPTPDTLLVQSVENGARSWKLLSTDDGKLSAPMADDAVVDEAMHDPLTLRLIGGVNIVDMREYVFLDPLLESRWKSVVKAFDSATE